MTRLEWLLKQDLPPYKKGDVVALKAALPELVPLTDELVASAYHDWCEDHFALGWARVDDVMTAAFAAYLRHDVGQRGDE